MDIFLDSDFPGHYNFFTLFALLRRRPSAGVVELEDARDSKSRVPRGRVGSIPTAGTIQNYTVF